MLNPKLPATGNPYDPVYHIDAVGVDLDSALTKIIGAARNFIVAEIKGRS